MVAMSFLWQRLELQYNHSLWVVLEIVPSKVSNATTGHLSGFFARMVQYRVPITWYGTASCTHTLCNGVGNLPGLCGIVCTVLFQWYLKPCS